MTHLVSQSFCILSEKYSGRSLEHNRDGERERKREKYVRRFKTLPPLTRHLSSSVYSESRPPLTTSDFQDLDFWVGSVNQANDQFLWVLSLAVTSLSSFHTSLFPFWIFSGTVLVSLAFATRPFARGRPPVPRLLRLLTARLLSLLAESSM